MNCDLSRCENGADVMVLFLTSKRPVPYCRYHAFRSSGRPRWKEELISSMTKVGRNDAMP
jgi:hypothetical protein